MYQKYLHQHLILLCCFRLAGCEDLTGSNICPKNGTKICCYNYHRQGDKCEECPPGYYGDNCKSTCSMGYFGRFCKETCECEFEDCDKVNGCNDAVTNTHQNKSINVGQDNGTSGVYKENFTSRIRHMEKFSFQTEDDKNNNKDTSVAVTVAIVSSTIAALLILVIIIFLLRKQVKIMKRRRNDKDIGTIRFTNVVMSKIYDEIGDGVTVTKLQKNSSMKKKSKGPEEKNGDGCSTLMSQSRGSYALLAEPKEQEIIEPDYECLVGNAKRQHDSKRENGKCSGRDREVITVLLWKGSGHQERGNHIIRVPSDYDTPPPLPTARHQEDSMQESDYQIPPKRMTYTLFSNEALQHPNVDEETLSHPTEDEDETVKDNIKSSDSNDIGETKEDNNAN